MRIFLSLLLAVLYVHGLAQEETEIRVHKYYIPASKEVFYVLKYKPSIKHGSYQKQVQGPAAYKEKGQYDHNVRTGIWEYSDAKGKVIQRIDFSKDSVLLHDGFPDAADVKILDGAAARANDTGRTPLLLGGRSKLGYYMLGFRYPAAARQAGIKGTVVVSAVITREGKMVDEKIVSGLGHGLDEEALRVARLIPDDWLPLKVNGVAVDARILIPMKLKPGF
ncbi:energy transducer TonB [Dawidia soli]|uniref:TonB family protein n=1 Tax=Dawidia soli TaxID=2782352 RepID=A0AAP2DE76_9BACT|nr:energy transducer TonB [Dawidia soli]MBT1689110.1 TonB family protein [Dawidia soli]